MRFGEIIIKRALSGFQYVNYNFLKEHINSQNFHSLLQSEIKKVDNFFQTNLEGQTYEFAAINYIAILKIIKKYNKVNSDCFTINLQTTSFGHTLQNGILAIDSLETCFCPVCISDSVMSAQLPCSHSVCFKCLKNMNSFGINSCPLCRSESTEANRVIDQILNNESKKYHVAKTKEKVKVMTWNICALTFPLHVSFIEIIVSLIFTGTFKTSDVYDVPLYISQDRIKRQADFIKQSNSDVILLQEVLDEKTVKIISAFLPEYMPVYCKERIKYLNVIIYGLCVLLVSALQLFLFKLIFPVGSHCLFVFVLWNLWKWRDSTLYAFLCGSIKGQLVILTKIKKINVNKSFVPFETPSVFCFSMFLLSLFRQRGFLTYRFKGIEIINTHMPHGMIQADCWNIIKQYCEKKIIILGGDFNPLPFSHVDLFVPLREIGLMNLESKYVTWNLNEALTRKSYLTPQNMQLDYIAHSKGTSTTQVLTTKDSDHYALSCEFVPDDDLMFEFED